VITGEEVPDSWTSLLIDKLEIFMRDQIRVPKYLVVDEHIYNQVKDEVSKDLGHKIDTLNKFLNLKVIVVEVVRGYKKKRFIEFIL